MVSAVFVMVGAEDNPLFEMEFSSNRATSDSAHVNQFVLHSALDVVDEMVLQSKDTYLKVVDKFNDQYISAFVSPGNVRMLLLHDSRNEDGIKAFFNDVHELYIKVLLNPFYAPHTRIEMPAFEHRVRVLGKKHL